ncbi:MAG: DUF1549 and DUF1553 domain-containing protein, partial [Planctomycetota bacterium]
PVPQVTPPGQTRSKKNPIDRFIDAKLKEANLTPLSQASRPVLLRRLCFDLTGLGPTPEQAERFLNDDSPTAYADLVDRLLASPAYGERWAQHWLDLVRFAETDGYEHDKVRAEAWRYRDWVIQALNDDMPYDRFVRLQIAGDELQPGDESAAIATGFLLCGPDMPDINLMPERRQMALNEITQNLGAVLLASQLGCAQCHDHRTDPISQTDFYRLQAYFAGTVAPEKNKPLGHRVEETSVEPPATFVLHRGDFREPRDEVAPAVPPAYGLSESHEVAIPDGLTTSGRRARLAAWLTSGDHPLVSRVMVNRIWQNHFGVGLVETPNDFGMATAEPRHVDLLNWLAGEFVRHGWSLKSMHRLMVTSQAYRRASGPSDAAWSKRDTNHARQAWDALIETDPSNTLLGRMNRKRMEGEAIRDTMLLAAGQLSDRRGGMGVRPPLPAEIIATVHKGHWIVSKNEEDHRRRSVYLFVRRNLRYPLFEVFDRPDANASCGRRQQSTTAPQALTLFNSDFSARMARTVADRAYESAESDADRVAACYELILGRPPHADEAERAVAFSTQHVDGLSDLCLALFNANAFVYID